MGVCMGMMFAMSSCATKQSAVNSLRSFQQELDTNGPTYTINDWKKAAKDYAKINKKIFKHYNEYTPQELEEVGALNGKCAASFAKGTATNIGNKAAGAINLIKGLVESVKEEMKR